MKKIVLLVCCIVLFVTGCAKRLMTDSGKSYAADRETDETVYEVTAAMIGMESYVSGGSVEFQDWYQTGRYWSETSGKGATLVYIESIEPGIDGMGGYTVIKTTDRKVMAVPAGFRMNLKCRLDYEPIAAVRNGQSLSDDAVTWELDYCRMVSGSIVPVDR